MPDEMDRDELVWMVARGLLSSMVHGYSESGGWRSDHSGIVRQAFDIAEEFVDEAERRRKERKS